MAILNTSLIVVLALPITALVDFSHVFAVTISDTYVAVVGRCDVGFIVIDAPKPVEPYVPVSRFLVIV